MNQTLLVRHPEPHPTESLLGYVVRLTEANGYASPKDLYRLAGVRAGRITVDSVETSILATITGHPVSQFEQIALTPKEKKPETLRLLGNIVDSRDLTLTYARVCPECIAEKGFIEAHWLIGIMVACSVHERAAVWYCPKCKKKISWLRSGLLVCQCGVPFSLPHKEESFEPELHLLDLVRRKALSDPILRNDTCMPEFKFAILDLRSTLRLISFLGRTRLSGTRQTGSTSRDVLRAAAQVLKNWPLNFVKLLRDIDPQGSNKNLAVEDFENVYKLVDQRFKDRWQGTDPSIAGDGLRGVTG